MLRFLHLIITYGIFILPFILISQVKEGVTVPKQITLEYKEKKLIEEAYQLYNNDDERAYKTAHKLLRSLKTKRYLISTNLLLANYFKKKTLIDSSIFYVNESLKYEMANDSLEARKQSFAYNILAVNYKTKGLYEECKKWHIKGIEIAERFNERYLYYLHTYGLANVYLEIDYLDQSLKLFKECLQYKEDKEIIMGSCINIGDIYTKIKDYKSSDKYLKLAYTLAKEDNNNIAIATIKFNLASNAQEQGKLTDALFLYSETIKIADKYDLHQLHLIAQMDIGSVFITLKRYQDAEAIYAMALYNAIELGYLGNQLSIYDNLKQIAINQSNYKNAFNFSTKFFKIKDSITKLQKDKEIIELEVRYQTLQKVKEIKVLQVENANRELDLRNQEEAIKNLKLQQEIEKKETQNKILSFQNASEKKRNEIIVLKKDQEIQESKLARQKSIKNSILYSFLVLLIPVIGLLITYYQKLQTQSELNKKQEEISEQKISSLIKDQELKLIKASIKGQDKERKRIALELHDSIGGNLAAIKLQLNNTVFYGDKKAITTINNQLDDTYEQVRDLSHNLIPKKFSKNNFCDVLEEYFNNIGGTTSLSTSFVAYPRTEIDILDETLQIEIFKIIQELITNTIKHAKASSVELQLNLVENMINILFEDNGIGFNTKNKANGIGFENIKNRLKKVSGTFYIDSRINRGTIIDIEVPALTSINDKVCYNH